MSIFIGLIIVSFILLYKRSTGIIVVNPLRGQRQAPLPGDEPETDENEDEDEASDAPPDFATLLNTIKEAAQNPASGQDRAAIMTLVQNNQIFEAIKLYRRLYGVDLQAAKAAVEAMRMEK